MSEVCLPTQLGVEVGFILGLGAGIGITTVIYLLKEIFKEKKKGVLP